MLVQFSDCRKFGGLNRFVSNQATVLFMKERFDRKIKTLTSSEHACSAISPEMYGPELI
jgi:hypothetical protein